MKQKEFDTRLPRLFVEGDLQQDTILPLDDKSAHYLKNVLRRPENSQVRVFNGRDGEFLARFSASDRKSFALSIESQIRPQNIKGTELHLFFAPIKKDRQDFLIEKAVELGATHLHPVLTQQTVIRDLNEERVKRQIQEAAEQCERLNCPELSPLKKLEDVLKNWAFSFPLLAALEREETTSLSAAAGKDNHAVLIGPEGGFSPEEKKSLLESPHIKPVSLGENILRAETASLYCLSVIQALN